MWVLDWFGKAVTALQTVMGAGERDLVLVPVPEAMHDLHLLTEHLESLGRRGKRKAVRPMFRLVPSGTHPELDPSSGGVVGGDHHLGQLGGMPERDGRDQRAEADP